MKNVIDFYEKDSIEIIFANSSHTFPLHSHECFCFGVIEAGEVSFTIGGKQRTLYPGMAYIIPSNIGVMIQAQKRYRYITICMKDKRKEQLKDLEFNDYFIKLSSAEIVRKLCTDYMNDGLSEKLVELITSIMKPVIVNKVKPSRERGKSEVIVAACRYIRAHAHEKFDLDVLADSIYISKFYLVKLFKREMGVTPNQYYIQMKMQLIKKEIINYRKEVDLAMELNFNDQSHLCNLFKRQMGISPQEYKKSFQKL